MDFGVVGERNGEKGIWYDVVGSVGKGKKGGIRR